MTGDKRYSKRLASRLAAVQALYQMQVGRVSAQEVLTDFQTGKDEGFSVKPDMIFVGNLVEGVTEHLPELDGIIRGHLSDEWTLERLDTVMLQILRAGSYELLKHPEIDVAVIITEYLSVAQGFFDKKEINFVHSLLDRVAKKVR